jgi:hypothetical protein
MTWYECGVVISHLGELQNSDEAHLGRDIRHNMYGALPLVGKNRDAVFTQRPL